jgi:riboflavin kinase
LDFPSAIRRTRVSTPNVAFDNAAFTIGKLIELEVPLPKLCGKVVSGMGNFSYWIEKLREHYLSKTGMELFPGTLNVQLDEAYMLPEQVIRLEGNDYGGTVSVNIVPCSIFGKRAFILRTDANEEGRGHHPRAIIEIATDVRLRDHFRLNDGDTVEVETFDLVSTE